MSSIVNLRLCGGTFFTLALQARYPLLSSNDLYAGKKEELTEPELLLSLVKICIKNYPRPDTTHGSTFAKDVSRYKSCRISKSSALPFGDSGAISSFDARIKNEYAVALSDMSEFTARFIDTVSDARKDTQLVRALMELIERDNSIDANQQFYVLEDGSPITKKNLTALTCICLQSFLLGVWHFVLTMRPDNEIGKFTYDAWCPPSGNRRRDFASTIGHSNNVSVYYLPVEHEEPLPDVCIPISLASAYLEKAKSKYNQIKTLLYTDAPKDFYSFYVCNGIEQRIYDSSSARRFSYRLKIIDEVTPAKLLSVSKYIILTGTGGLGKSMMLRHLLLTSIENFSESQVLPVFIPLKDFDGNTLDVFEYIYAKINCFGTGVTKQHFMNVLSSGKCLLLFDGLDEIGSKLGTVFETRLESFMDLYPENQYVISSRPYKSFVSYSRFTTLALQPFYKAQALELVDKLEYRTDEPAIKNKFRDELEATLFQTHRGFTENPLLLTIMLMTFEQFAEIPSKMHIFYREAFIALSQKHDASKGAYKRVLKTGLTTERYGNYFAEFCSRTYHDEKFELTESDFENYYYQLSERKKDGDNLTTASDYIYDTCTNMCLMFFESGKYFFTHRSFQEYFCAYYFSKQKDKNLRAIGEFFEKRRSRNYGDKTFVMLYDMIPDKIDEYIFVPFLSELFNKCDNANGYWTFLEIMYPIITYKKGDVDAYVTNSPSSYLYDFIKHQNFDNYGDCDSLSFDDSLVTEEYCYVEDGDGNEELIELNEVDYDYKMEHGTPEVVGWVLEVDVSKTTEKPAKHKRLIAELDSDDFVLKQEYLAARQYFDKILSKTKPSGNSLFDLFN